MFYYIFNWKFAGKYIVEHKESILLFRLIIYVLYLLIHTFSISYIGLLYTHTVALVNLLSNEIDAVR